VILGATGRNFAAGMSGGLAYVYDVNGLLPKMCNAEMVDLDPVFERDAMELRAMIEEHVAYTGSTVGGFILADFDAQIKNFVKVFPKDYKAVLASANVVAISEPSSPNQRAI
jgi:glutamate synthase (NADPH/NADH) large chain